MKWSWFKKYVIQIVNIFLNILYLNRLNEQHFAMCMQIKFLSKHIAYFVIAIIETYSMQHSMMGIFIPQIAVKPISKIFVTNY